MLGSDEIKVSLFADDTTCLLNDIASVICLLKLCEQFSKCSGLRLNVQKTIMIYIGPWKEKGNIPNYDISIESECVNVLGITLGLDTLKCQELNFNKKIDKMKKKLNMWSQRGLTLIGKILISKSMGLSNLIYSLSCVESTNANIAKAQKTLNDFIWRNRIPKIKHKVLSGPYGRSGIRAPDVTIFNKCLRLAWISRLWDDKLWNKVFEIQIAQYGGIRLLLHTDYDYNLLRLAPFYKNIFAFFRELNDGHEYKGVLWNNKDICIGGKMLFKKQWYQKGIIYVKDLLDKALKPLTRQEIATKYNVDVDPLYYNGLKCILSRWIKNVHNHIYLSPEYNVDIQSCVFKLDNNIINVKKAKCKDYYNIYLDKNTETPTSTQYWID